MGKATRRKYIILPEDYWVSSDKIDWIHVDA
jgi:hypothetical protein